MKKYTEFNRNDLKKKIAYLEKLKLTIKDEKELEEIDKEIYLLDNLLMGNEVDSYFDIDKKEKLIDIMNDNYRFLETIPEYIPLYLRYKELLKKSLTDNEILRKGEIINENAPHETSYTNKKVIRIVHDFYNSLPDKEIRNIFNKEYKNHRTNIRFLGTESGASTTNYSSFKYINVATDGNYEKIPYLTHEYGHLIHDNILNKVIFYNDNYPFIELMSEFFEALAVDYVYGMNNEKRSTVQILNKTLDLYNEIYCLNLNIEMKDTNFKTSHEIRNYILQNHNRISLDFSYIRKAELDYTYSFPLMIIIELMGMYEKDPEKTLYLLKELCKLENCNYLEELEKRHIYLGENIENHVKKLSHRIDTSFNIKSNH